MVNSLTKRVGRIISGSIHAMVNAIEDAAPEVVMEESIREIESALNEVRNELGKVIASKHLANKKLLEKNAQHEKCADQIEVAIAQKRDDLAEAAIAHQLDIEAQIPVLEQTVISCGEQEKELESYIAALLAKKREMKEELKMFREHREAESSATAITHKNAPRPGSTVQNKVDSAESAFGRVLERQTGLASGNQDISLTVQLAELEKMTRENRIKERLAAVKKTANA